MIALRVALAAIVLAAGMAVVSAGGVLYLERRDSFCATCHTQPETMYFERSVDAAAGGIDLASFHYLEEGTRCIDCHGGVGPPARLGTLLLAAGDTAQFVTGLHEQPAMMEEPLPNPNCRQCHNDTIVRAGFENHFHNRMDDPEAPALFCTACHASHQEGEERAFFVRENDVFPTCNRCHDAMGGPSELR